MKKRFSFVCLLLAAGMSATLLAVPRAGAAGRADGPFQVLSDTSQALVLAFALPDWSIEPAQANGQAFVRIEAQELASSNVPGAPALPVASALLGLPPDGRPIVEVVESRYRRVPLPEPVSPAPEPVPVQISGEGEVPVAAEAGYVFSLDEAVYSEDAFYPTQNATVAEVGWLRDQKLGRVTVYPFRYHPRNKELEVIEWMVLEIRFQHDGAATLAAAGVPVPAFAHVLYDTLLNDQTAQMWRARPSLQTATLHNPAATQPGSIKVLVESDGLYQLTYADLAQAGVPVSTLDPSTLRLYESGQEVALQVVPQGSGYNVLFYGRAPRSRYTAQNVYWLRYGGAAGLRMSTRSVAPAGVPAGVLWGAAQGGENRFYDSNRPAADGDHWYAADIRPTTPYTAAIELMPLSTGSPTATLQIGMVGYTQRLDLTPDHHVRVSVNGQSVGELWWDGTSPVTGTWTLNRTILQPGQNRVTLHLPEDTGAPVEGVWLDTIEITYPLQTATEGTVHVQGMAGTRRYALGGFTSGAVLYDVSDPRRPVLLQGAAVGSGLSFADTTSRPADYLVVSSLAIRRPSAVAPDVPSQLYRATNRADYVIIVPAELAGAVQPLAEFRRRQGLEVVVVDVQDIYDEFSAGLLDPEAIRSFVACAYNEWAKAPVYVLLVGDGSYDFMDHHGYGSANLIPPYLAMVDPWWGEVAADNRYAAVSGDDPLPDVLLGRLPVETAAQAAAVVAKIVQYEQAPMPGEWNAQHVFVADDADYAGHYDQMLDDVIETYVAAPWQGTRIYLGNLSAETARQQTLAAWQQGALVVSFAGHSSWHQWAVEALLNIHDIGTLQNDRRWPMVLSMTCFTGFFDHPEYGTLDEELLRLGGGGAIATWSPSGLGVSTGHDRLFAGFYRTVFDRGQAQIGAATLAGKLDLYAQAPMHADLIETYHLFGDPAMALDLDPGVYRLFLPLISKYFSGG